MSLNYDPHKSNPTDIIFGNGSSTQTNSEVNFGRFSALLCEDSELSEDLISVNPFLDSGYLLHMEGSGGYLLHPTSGERIAVERDGPRWTIDLEDMSRLQEGPAKEQAVAALSSLYTVNTSTVRESESQRQRVLRLHTRMGHASTETMCGACEAGGAWSHSGLTASMIRRVMRKDPCIACWLAKRNKGPVPEASSDRAEHLLPGEIISADIVGKISPAARNGDCYFFLFADVKTGYQHAFTGATKSGFVTALQKVVEWYRQKGLHPKILRTDAERVLTMGDVAGYLAKECMDAEHSVPYAHYQNFVERYVQSAVKGVSTLLHAQRFLKLNDWDKALFHYVDCRNHSPNSKCRNNSPHQRISGQPTNVSKKFQFSFGDLVSIRVPVELRQSKFDLRHDVGIYVGQPDHSVDGSLVYMPYTGEQLIRTDLALLDISDEAYRQYFSRKYDLRDVSRSAWRDIADVLGDLEIDFDGPVQQDGLDKYILKAPLMEQEELPRPLHAENRRKALIERSDRILRSASARAASIVRAHPGSPESDLFIHLAVQALAAKSSRLTVGKALKSNEANEWQKAIRDEIESLLEVTKSLVPEPIDESKPYHLINATMQLKKKMKTATILDKYKARCCACGNQLEGLITETFSPTVSSLAHSVLHQIAIIDDMETCLIDTVAAYLNQPYPEDATPLYLKLPRAVAEACGLHPDVTYRVKKYIYGLPDAGRAYYLAYREHLIAHGYSATASDPCLFVKFDEERSIYIWFHVDDTFVAATCTDELTRLQDILRLRFEITINNEVDNHLGVCMEKLSDGSVKLSQPKLLQQIFDEYDFELNKSHRGAPVPLRTVRFPATDPRDDVENDEALTTEYLHLLGMLNYMTRSRPDVCTALSFAATHSSAPTKIHFDHLLDIVRYLWETRDKSLIIRKGNGKNTPLQLTCYVDASYLTHPDSRSHSGYCMTFGNIGSFYVKSGKQQLVATSSTHAEVRALYQLIVEIVYVVNLCDELRRPVALPAVIFEDNQPAIDLSGSLSGRVKKCKHFLMLVNYIREQVASGLISIQKISTEDNIADVLTKALTGNAFTEKANFLLGI